MKNKQSKPSLLIRIVGSRIAAYCVIVVLTVILVAGKSHREPVPVVHEYDPCSPKVDMGRHTVNRFTRPNLLNDEYVECTDLSVLKDQLSQYIEDEKKRGGAMDVS